MRLLIGHDRDVLALEERLAASLSPICKRLCERITANPNDQDLQALFWSLSTAEASLYGRGVVFKYIQFQEIKPYYLERELIPNADALERVAKHEPALIYGLDESIDLHVRLREATR